MKPGSSSDPMPVRSNNSRELNQSTGWQQPPNQLDFSASHACTNSREKSIALAECVS